MVLPFLRAPRMKYNHRENLKLLLNHCLNCSQNCSNFSSMTEVIQEWKSWFEVLKQYRKWFICTNFCGDVHKKRTIYRKFQNDLSKQLKLSMWLCNLLTYLALICRWECNEVYENNEWDHGKMSLTSCPAIMKLQFSLFCTASHPTKKGQRDSQNNTEQATPQYILRHCCAWIFVFGGGKICM